jgi:quercetin dioxygenase-like cupin family protein
MVPSQDGGCSLRLSLYRFETGVETIGGNRVVYDLGRGVGSFGAATVDGPALVWQFDHDEFEAEGALLTHFVQLDPFAQWIVRCDRVDFPLGAVAPAHTHPGPGIRYLLHGEIEIETEGRATFLGPGGAWFESGPEPVVARASAHLETSFVRALVLPAKWAGRRTIQYADPHEGTAERQSASALLEHPIALPR